jgi:hypothetical protein
MKETEEAKFSTFDSLVEESINKVAFQDILQGTL